MTIQTSSKEYLQQARKKLKEKRALRPDLARGQMNFSGFAMAEEKRKREWRGGFTAVKNDPEHFKDEEV